MKCPHRSSEDLGVIPGVLPSDGPVCLLCFVNKFFFSYFQEFACNGVVIEHPEYGEVLQLQGDQRTKVCAWLSNPKIGLVRADQLKVHGF